MIKQGFTLSDWVRVDGHGLNRLADVLEMWQLQQALDHLQLAGFVLVERVEQPRPYVRIEAPEAALAREVAHGQKVLVDFAEGAVEGQIVADRVLPGAGGHAPVVGEVADHPGVDLFDGEAAARRRLDGEEGEAAV